MFADKNRISVHNRIMSRHGFTSRYEISVLFRLADGNRSRLDDARSFCVS